MGYIEIGACILRPYNEQVASLTPYKFSGSLADGTAKVEYFLPNKNNRGCDVDANRDHSFTSTDVNATAAGATCVSVVQNEPLKVLEWGVAENSIVLASKQYVVAMWSDQGCGASSGPTQFRLFTANEC